MALTPEAVKGLRRRLGLTQAAFAARLGVSTQAVSFWERGTRTPTGLSARALRALAAETASHPTGGEHGVDRDEAPTGP